MGDKRDEFLNELRESAQSSCILENGQEISFDEPVNAKSTRYTCKGQKSKIKKFMNNAGYRKERIRRWAATAGVIMVLAGGTGKVGKEVYDNTEQKSTISDIMLVENKDTRTIEEDFGITLEVYNEINEINEALENPNISNTELIQMAKRMSDLSLDLGKTKIGNALGLEEEDIKNIIIHAEGSSSGERKDRIEVGDTIYNVKTLFGGNSNTISPEIGKYVQEVGRLYTLIGSIEVDNIDRDKLIKNFKEKMVILEKFAGAEITVDDKGNMRMEYGKEKPRDIRNAIKEQSASNQQEIDDEREI